MQIICPECQFSRTVKEGKIPSQSVMATCPKCKTKFRFRADPDQDSTSSSAPLKPAEDSEERSQATPEQSLPPLHDPTEKPGDELWRTIGDMTPPQEPSDPATPPSKKESFSAFGEEETLTEQQTAPVVEVPFERLDTYGFFQGLVTTIKRVLLSPQLFFSVMPLGRGITRPLIFALIILTVHDTLQALYIKAGILPAMGLGADAITAAEKSQFNPFVMAVLAPLMWSIILFLSAGLQHLLLTALKASEGRFEATFRVATYATAPIILGYLPLGNGLLFKAQILVIFFWNMGITIIGWKNLHKTTYLRATLAAVIPLLVVGAAMISSLYVNTPQI